MRVEGVTSYYPWFQTPSFSSNPSGNAPPVVSKDLMMKLLNLVMYNQSGMAFKLARIASEMYAGMNLDYQA